MTIPQVIVGLVVALRLGELIHARRNARRLRAQGGIEVGAGHYPWLVGLHAAWLVALAVTVAVRDQVPVHAAPLGLFVVLMLARWWVIASLGKYWTTRIITVPGAPLVTAGPYRFLRHPNYVVVALEIAVLPLVFGAWEIAAAFTIANGILLTHRIRVEDAALAVRRGYGYPSTADRETRIGVTNGRLDTICRDAAIDRPARGNQRVAGGTMTNADNVRRGP